MSDREERPSGGHVRPSHDSYDAEESQERAKAALKAAFGRPHQSMKEIPRKRPRVQRGAHDDLGDMIERGDPTDMDEIAKKLGNTD